MVRTLLVLLAERGLSEADVERALAYAEAAGAKTTRAGFDLAISRAMLTDEQLAAGVRFTGDGMCRL